MRSFKLALGLGLLFVTASAAPAFAQSAGGGYPAPCVGVAVPQAKSDDAHAFYTVGRAFYDEGNYERAIEQFREAYKRDCSKHDLLIIISRSYELKGDRAEAIRALEVFLERVKDSPEAGTHRTKIDNLKKQLAAQPAVVPPPPPKQEVREHTIPPWIVVGVGGAGILTGAALLIAGPARPEFCPSDPGSTEFNPQGGCRNSSDSEQATSWLHVRNAGLVVLFSGTAIAAGGLLWHFLEPTGPVTATGSIKPKLTPALAPGYAGLSLGATF